MTTRTQGRGAGGGGRSRRGGGRTSGGSRRGAPKPKKSYANIAPLEPVETPPDIESFSEFDLGDDIQKAIADMGITKPTPIQALAIEPVLKGKDVIAKAETGTGKTLAFGAPMMAKIDPDRASVLGLVLSPTRELAEQVHKVLEELGNARGVKTTLIVGGEQMGPQVKAIQAGTQVVVGTPGRVLDLLNQRFLQFPWTEYVILDEADKMLEIGFIDDVKKILDACNEYRKTLLFSATFPPQLLELARGYTTDPAEIATASGVATVDNIHQYFLKSSEDDRAKHLAHLIEDSAQEDVFLVFCERRTDVDRLLRSLERKRFSVKALHGGYDQAARFRVMAAFRTGDVKCLVATDVASRGLDVNHVTHVVNLGVPRDVSDYTHRIGRTGRAGRHGVALTIVTPRDERDFGQIKNQPAFDLREIHRARELFESERRRLKAKELGEDEPVDVESEDVTEGRRPSGRPSQRPEDRDGDRERRPRRSRGEGRRPRRDEEDSRAPREETAEASTEERRPRRTRRPRAERETEQPEAATETREERPRRTRRPRPEREAEAPETSEERPRRARRPRRDDAEASQAPAESDDRPRRRRSRSERETESTEEARERPARRSPRRDDEERPAREGRRERRPRRDDESSESARGSQSRDEAPEREERPRRRRPARDDQDERPRTESSEGESRPRRERRPRRDSESRGSRLDEEPREEPGEPRRRPRARFKDDDERPARRPRPTESDEPSRPRRNRRDASEEAPGAKESESERPRRRRERSESEDSTAKPRSDRPKRAPRSEDAPAAPKSPPAGGFGSGI